MLEIPISYIKFSIYSIVSSTPPYHTTTQTLTHAYLKYTPYLPTYANIKPSTVPWFKPLTHPYKYQDNWKSGTTQIVHVRQPLQYYCMYIDRII